MAGETIEREPQRDPAWFCILAASPVALAMAAAVMLAGMVHETNWWGTLLTAVGIAALFIWWALLLRNLP